MADKEKVRNGLEQCANDNENCKRCPYFVNGVMCTKKLARDALEVLDADEEYIKRTISMRLVNVVRRKEESEWNCCENCGSHVISKWKWCPYCGRGLVWKDE